MNTLGDAAARWASNYEHRRMNSISSVNPQLNYIRHGHQESGQQMFTESGYVSRFFPPIMPIHPPPVVEHGCGGNIERLESSVCKESLRQKSIVQSVEVKNNISKPVRCDVPSTQLQNKVKSVHSSVSLNDTMKTGCFTFILNIGANCSGTRTNYSGTKTNYSGTRTNYSGAKKVPTDMLSNVEPKYMVENCTNNTTSDCSMTEQNKSLERKFAQMKALVKQKQSESYLRKKILKNREAKKKANLREAELRRKVLDIKVKEKIKEAKLRRKVLGMKGNRNKRKFSESDKIRNFLPSVGSNHSENCAKRKKYNKDLQLMPWTEQDLKKALLKNRDRNGKNSILKENSKQRLNQAESAKTSNSIYNSVVKYIQKILQTFPELAKSKNSKLLLNSTLHSNGSSRLIHLSNEKLIALYSEVIQLTLQKSKFTQIKLQKLSLEVASDELELAKAELQLKQMQADLKCKKLEYETKKKEEKRV